MEKDNLLTIERGFWHEGADYYNEHIAENALFVFPGMILNKEDGVSSADKAPRWDDLEIKNEKVIQLTDSTTLLSYHARGVREGSEPYSGNITSIYSLVDGNPKLLFHQHTPDPQEQVS